MNKKQGLWVLILVLVVTAVIAPASDSTDPSSETYWKEAISTGDYSKVNWETVNWNTLPESVRNDIDQSKIPLQYVSSIEPEFLKPEQLSDPQLNLLTADQLNYNQGTTIQKVKDLSKLDSAALDSALKELFNQPGVDFTIDAPGTRYIGTPPTLYFESTGCAEGLPTVTCTISATDLQGENVKILAKHFDDNKNGFIVCTADNCKQVKGIGNVKTDNKGNVIVSDEKGKGKGTLTKGSLEIAVDEKGNYVFLTDKGTSIEIRGVRFTGKGKLYTKGDSVIAEGLYSVHGKEFGAWATVVGSTIQITFDEGDKVTEINGNVAKLSMHGDIVEGSFKATITDGKRIESVTLSNKGLSKAAKGTSYFQLSGKTKVTHTDKGNTELTISAVDNRNDPVFRDSEEYVMTTAAYRGYHGILQELWEKKPAEVQAMVEQMGVSCDNCKSTSSWITRAYSELFKMSCTSKDHCADRVDYVSKQVSKFAPTPGFVITRDGSGLVTVGKGKIEMLPTTKAATIDLRDSSARMVYNPAQKQLFLTSESSDVKDLAEITAKRTSVSPLGGSEDGVSTQEVRVRHTVENGKIKSEFNVQDIISRNPLGEIIPTQIEGGSITIHTLSEGGVSNIHLDDQKLAYGTISAEGISMGAVADARSEDKVADISQQLAAFGYGLEFAPANPNPGNPEAQPPEGVVMVKGLKREDTAGMFKRPVRYIIAHDAEGIEVKDDYMSLSPEEREKEAKHHAQRVINSWNGREENGLGAHYLVYPDGQILQVLDENKIGAHTVCSPEHPDKCIKNGVNGESVGFDFVHTKSGQDVYTASQYDRAKELIGYLREKHGVCPTCVFAHEELYAGHSDLRDTFEWNYLRAVVQRKKWNIGHLLIEPSEKGG